MMDIINKIDMYINAVNEKTEYTNATLTSKMMQDDYVPINNGDGFFVVCQINTTNFSDMPPKMVEQFKKENILNKGIGFICDKATPKFSINGLPVFGNSKTYVTKGFKDSKQKAIQSALRDKADILNRANK